MKDSSLEAAALEGKAVANPLKITNAVGNSIHSTDDYFNANKHNASKSHNRFRLSDLPNIDSSSEEELGMRTKMMPPPPDDDINCNNNEADEQQDESHQSV